MLDPDGRLLYTTSLAPPDGMRLDEALATTYSLDLVTLVTIPMSLVVRAGASFESLLADPVGLLEAMHRTAERISVFCQTAHVLGPRLAHPLFTQLEGSLHEVAAPGGGTFHPKLWVLRYLDAEDRPFLRLLVMSRNLTADRSWDVLLVLEGQRGEVEQPGNRPLVELLRALPRWARLPDEAPTERAERLADDVLHTAWELPPDFDGMAFHTLGMGGQSWTPPRSDRLLVVSPFCSAGALIHLAETTRRAEALVSRAEALDALPLAVLSRYQQVAVMSDRATWDDGEDADGRTAQLRGLHAKIYVAEHGRRVTMAVGSANASSQALLNGANVELLVELTGGRRRVGGIDDFLSRESFGRLLDPYEPPAAPVPVTDAAQERLEEARKALAEAEMRLAFEPAEEQWVLVLVPTSPVELGPVGRLRAWPVTLPERRAVDAVALCAGQAVRLAACELASVTRLIAFQLAYGDKVLAFVLNVPTDGLPEGRDAAVIRAVLKDRPGFLRYLLRMLSDLTGESIPGVGKGGAEGWWPTRQGDEENLAVLEPLLRALARDPDRLGMIRRTVERLASTSEGEQILPDGFLELWGMLVAILEERSCGRDLTS